MMSTIILGVLLAVAVGCCFWLAARLRQVRERTRQQLQGIEIERQSIASLIEMASREMERSRSVQPFVDGFAEFVRRTAGFGGAAVFERNNDGYVGMTVAGMFPPLRGVDPGTLHRLLGDDHIHSEHVRDVRFDPGFEPFAAVCMRQSPVVYQSQRPPWLPIECWQPFRAMALLPIRFSGETVAILILAARHEDESITDDDADRLLPLCEIAGICLNAIRATLDRIKAQRRFQSAREEGMLQVTTGIVHNVGNAAAVIELLLEELRRDTLEPNRELVALFEDELLPIIRDDGDAQSFRETEAGQGFLEAMELFIGQFRRNAGKTEESLAAVVRKLDGVQRILSLQQRFAGELGTEERALIQQPLKDALVIVRPALEEKQVAVVEEFDEATPEVLIDRSMLMQVYVNLLQNAIEVLAKQDPPRKILVTTGVKVIHAEPWVFAEIADSGPGMPTGVFKALKNIRVSTDTADELPISPPTTDEDLFGRGLDYLRRVIRKYDGRLEVRRPADGGTRIRIMLHPAG